MRTIVQNYANTTEALLTSEEIAAALRVAPATVVWWRSQHCGPKWIRLGRGRRAPIRYRPSALHEYIEQMEQTNTIHHSRYCV